MADASIRLSERLARLHVGASRRTLKQWLAAGRVQVNGQVVRRGDVPVAATDRVRLTAPVVPRRFPSPLRLVHEDDDLLVVDKPPGLLTVATERERVRTVYRLLAEYVAAGRRPQRLFVVHRLDRETSGLLVFAKSMQAKGQLQEQFKARTAERVYAAVVEGRVHDPAGVLTARLAADRSLRVRPTRDGSGRLAVTRYRVLEQRAASAVLELTLVTGRRGQLRAQLAALGHAIVGDAAYGSTRNPAGRMCLHATRLGFVHPRGQTVRFESPVPAAFRRA